jgi:hypothetical protein
MEREGYDQETHVYVSVSGANSLQAAVCRTVTTAGGEESVHGSIVMNPNNPIEHDTGPEFPQSVLTPS